MSITNLKKQSQPIEQPSALLICPETGNDIEINFENITPLQASQMLNNNHQLNRNIKQHVVQGHIMIETGMKWAKPLLADFKEKYHNARIIQVEYRSSSKMIPSAIVYASTDPEYNYTDNPINKSGYKLVSELVGSVCLNGNIVIDACCGMGYTLQACIDHNLVFRGNEFNPVRLTKAIKRLK